MQWIPLIRYNYHCGCTAVLCTYINKIAIFNARLWFGWLLCLVVCTQFVRCSIWTVLLLSSLRILCGISFVHTRAHIPTSNAYLFVALWFCLSACLSMPIQYSCAVLPYNTTSRYFCHSHAQFIKMQNDAFAWLLPHSVCSHLLSPSLSPVRICYFDFMLTMMLIFLNRKYIQKRYSHVIYFTILLIYSTLSVFPLQLLHHIHTNPFDRFYFGDHENATFPGSITFTFNLKFPTSCSLNELNSHMKRINKKIDARMKGESTCFTRCLPKIIYVNGRTNTKVYKVRSIPMR